MFAFSTAASGRTAGGGDGTEETADDGGEGRGDGTEETAGGEGRGDGTEKTADDGGKGADDAGGFSAAYLEVAAMATERGFDANKSRCSDGSFPLFFALGAGQVVTEERVTADGYSIAVNDGADGVPGTPLTMVQYDGSGRRTLPTVDEDCLVLVLGMPGIDPNIRQSSWGHTVLYFAVIHNAWRCVELLLEAKGVDVNLANEGEHTPLFGAAAEGHPECVARLLKAPGIMVNKVNADGYTPLASAANRGKFECVKLLLEDPRVDLMVPCNEGMLPLWHACLHVGPATNNMVDCDGRTDDHTDPIRGLVLFLRSRRVTAMALNHVVEGCRLHLPSKRETFEAEAGGEPLDMWQLMARHVLPILQAQARGKRRWCDWCLRVTPDKDLDLCGGCNQVGYCDRACCQKKAWKHGGHKEACTSMGGGFSTGYHEVATMAKEPGFDVNDSLCSDGFVPIFFAMGALSREAPVYEDCLALVLKMPGANPNVQDVSGQSVIHMAASTNEWRCVEHLLAAPGIDANLQDKEGRTPLRNAVGTNQWRDGDDCHSDDHCNPKCVEMLLSFPGIDVNKADNTGCTPLIWATNQGNTKCVEMLLDADKIKVNQANDIGLTALGTASNQGKSKCTKLLLEDPRVDVNARTNGGVFPLWQACLHLTLDIGNIGTCDGRNDTDPIRGLILFLRSRRVSTKALTSTIKACKRELPSKREIATAKAGGKPLDNWHRMARHVLPILEAQAIGERRWCDWCLRATPDKDLLLCGGCEQVGYCDQACCQQKAWVEGGHKKACAGMAAEAEASAETAAKAGEGKDEGGGGGKKTRKGKKKGGRR